MTTPEDYEKSAHHEDTRPSQKAVPPVRLCGERRVAGRADPVVADPTAAETVKRHGERLGRGPLTLPWSDCPQLSVVHI